MEKTLVIYKSNTGFAEKYAKWLSEELNCDLLNYENRNTINWSDYEAVIYGGGIYAGSINGIDWLKSKLPELKNKKVVVYATGAMPADAPETKEAMEKNFTVAEAAQVKSFFLHSGLCYEKMAFKHKLMMKMFCKMLKTKNPQTYQILRLSFDHTSKEALKPLLAYINDNEQRG